jgi:hypothetical protein
LHLGERQLHAARLVHLLRQRARERTMLSRPRQPSTATMASGNRHQQFDQREAARMRRTGGAD